TRRDFLKTSTKAVAAGSLAATVALQTPMVHAADSDVIKVALIGCGGRGTGAAVNAMHAHPNNRLTVMCDLFSDQLDSAKARLGRSLGQQYAVTDDQCFTGFDGYLDVMKTDVDVVILTTPPHFRPMQLKACIDAGKHVFCEKPVAVDAPGVRSVFETVEAAKKKNLTIVSGLCWRYDLGVRETMKRIQDGAIGDVVAVQENYLTGTLWHRGRKDDWSEMEYQCRNWLYFTWLSGDHINEQHIHSLDKGLWLNDDQAPLACYGLGGRQVRTSAEWGNIYDHHAVCYEFPNNVRVYAYTRQQGGCFNEVDDIVLGSKGQARILKNSIDGAMDWSYSGPRPSMYDVEHKELFDALRAGQTINNGDYMAKSTMMAIMGRMATYTGQRVTWDMAIGSKEDLRPSKYEWGGVDVPGNTEIAMPGKTKFV
ncbi:MAG: Gfo/Idh/MocA family oxidoreductase, partial [Planctomycetales bacterium]|nr:Gfo/Idh/MocA family oxidoreductase [Planctomycetales bacterium]